MTNELLVIAILGIAALGAMNFNLGRCGGWKHERLMKWGLSYISSLLIVASAIMSIWAYCSDAEKILKSPLTIILAISAIFLIAWLYSLLFVLGVRFITGYRPNDPNKTYDINELDDAPPMPTKAN